MPTYIKGNDTSTFGGNVDLGTNTLTQNNLTGFTAKAWVKFNGTGTPAIIGSGNVSSITDIGTGTQTVNFTTAMPTADYNFVTGYSLGNNNADLSFGLLTTSLVKSTTQVKLGRFYNSGTFWDDPYMCVSIFC